MKSQRSKKQRKVEFQDKQLPPHFLISKESIEKRIKDRHAKQKSDPDFELVNDWEKIQEVSYEPDVAINVWHNAQHNSSTPHEIKNSISSQLEKETEIAKSRENKKAIGPIVSVKGMSKTIFYENDNDIRRKTFETNFTDYRTQTSLGMNQAIVSVAEVMFGDKKKVPQEIQPFTQNETVGRAYRADFLRPADPTNNERPCCFENQCVSLTVNMLISQSIKSAKQQNDKNGFIAREWLTPQQNKDFRDKRIFPPLRKPCVLCNDYITYVLHLSIKKTGRNAGDISEDKVFLAKFGIPQINVGEGNKIVQIHDHTVKIGTDPDSYSEDECLIPSKSNFTGLFGPVKKFTTENLILQWKEKSDNSNGKGILVPHWVELQRNFH